MEVLFLIWAYLYFTRPKVYSRKEYEAALKSASHQQPTQAATATDADGRPLQRL